jgi:sucrose phosphorylase
MEGQTELNQTIRDRLENLYGARAQEADDRIAECLRSNAHLVNSRVDVDPRMDTHGGATFSPHPRWSERDVVLITYGDQIHPSENRPHNATPLATLREWLSFEQLQGLLSVVHLLPFSPYSSDDGFSVIDYRQVASEIGTWDDVRDLADDFDLMFDLVLNHVSAHSEWFAEYRRGEPPWEHFFIECDPEEDLSQVTRPRSLPLLTPVETVEGERHVWTTFSSDQVDLNFAEPAVLAEMLDILLEYVDRGARIVRLDAIAYLWKRLGTNCIHLPETHQVVKLMRDVLDLVAPEVILLTETNVPHRENVSYFGDGDEAHMVYQFSLPPLVLDAFIHADATPLKNWLASLEPPEPGTTYFNFTSSHDGIGMRPLEGLVSDERLHSLVEAVRKRGGRVNTRRRADGSEAPYELNVTYVDALGGDASVEGDGVAYDDEHLRRFMATQAIMLSLQGIPGVYFHCLVGSPNDLDAVEQSGQNRRINRHKYRWDELIAATSTDSFQRKVLAEYSRMLEIRRHQPAFHPDAVQIPLALENQAVIGWAREQLGGQRSTEQGSTEQGSTEQGSTEQGSEGQRIIVLANVSSTVQVIDQGELVQDGEAAPSHAASTDLLSTESNEESEMRSEGAIELGPYQVKWLTEIVE